jgi:hypothetical protein
MAVNQSYARLKTRQRAERHTHSEGLALRVHRALSWLNRAEQCENDEDGRFIFLWISFNAAYAQPFSLDEQSAEKQKAEAFIKKLVDLDTQNRLYDLLWTVFPSTIRVLLDNRYVFQPFWDAKGRGQGDALWKAAFEGANRAARSALGRGDTATVLSVVLARLYTLRNQLVHGGATWNSQVNREQIRDCARLMSELMPRIIEIMMDHPHTLWGDAVYPVIS